jgi:hypothetical protein
MDEQDHCNRNTCTGDDLTGALVGNRCSIAWVTTAVEFGCFDAALSSTSACRYGTVGIRIKEKRQLSPASSAKKGKSAT